MVRLVPTACVILLCFLGAFQQDRLKKFHQVEGYEIRPGIIAVPYYSAEGKICTIALEKRHFSLKAVDLDAEMPEEQVHQIFDELAPVNDRGRQLIFDRGGSLTLTEGPAVIAMMDYENVSLRMYGKSKQAGKTEYVVAIIQWKTSNCKRD
jgi:hypothetical protein